MISKVNRVRAVLTRFRGSGVKGWKGDPEREAGPSHSAQPGHQPVISEDFAATEWSGPRLRGDWHHSHLQSRPPAARIPGPLRPVTHPRTPELAGLRSEDRTATGPSNPGAPGRLGPVLQPLGGAQSSPWPPGLLTLKCLATRPCSHRFSAVSPPAMALASPHPFLPDCGFPCLLACMWPPSPRGSGVTLPPLPADCLQRAGPRGTEGSPPCSPMTQPEPAGATVGHACRPPQSSAHISPCLKEPPLATS